MPLEGVFSSRSFMAGDGELSGRGGQYRRRTPEGAQLLIIIDDCRRKSNPFTATVSTSSDDTSYEFELGDQKFRIPEVRTEKYSILRGWHTKEDPTRLTDSGCLDSYWQKKVKVSRRSRGTQLHKNTLNLDAVGRLLYCSIDATG